MEEQRQQAPTIEECVQMAESFGIVDELRPLLFGPDKDGILWQPMGSLPFSNAYLRFFQTVWFNKIARYQSDYLYRVNGYAQSAIENLVTMTMGSGFAYQCENQSLQNRLDEFMHRTKFKRRSREAFIRLLTQGEVFYRRFDDELRFVEPDLIYDSQHNGIQTDPEDYETVQSYYVMGKAVSPEEIQHRKLALSGEKRGVSILFSIGSHLMSAEQLLHNLTRTADQQSRFAVIRSHKANADAVTAFKSNIIATQRSQGLQSDHLDGRSRESYENYAPGTMIDTGDSTDWTFPGSAIDASKYVDVLRAVLRLCAARVGLPENILSQDQDSMGAYNSSLVADGHSTKAMEVWQERLAEWDLELFEMFGFDSARIKPVLPEIALHDKNALVLEAGFLKANKLASDSTLAKMFNLDLGAEREQMKLEEPAPETEDNMPEDGTDPDAKGGDSGEETDAGTIDTISKTSEDDGAAS